MKVKAFRGWLGLLLLGIAMLAGLPAAQAKPVPVPAMSSRVVDLTNTLRSSETADLRQQIAALETNTQAQLAVLIVPTTGEDSIEQYATRVFAQWQLGREGEDDGVLLLVALKDRRMRIEVGTGLESRITDIQAARVIDQQMKPRFRENDYAGGIQAAVQSLSQMIDAPTAMLPIESEAPVPEEKKPHPLAAFMQPLEDMQMNWAALGVMLWTLAVGIWYGRSAPATGTGPRVVVRGTGKRGRKVRRAAERETAAATALWADLQTQDTPPRKRPGRLTVLGLVVAGQAAAALAVMNLALPLFLLTPASLVYGVGYLSGRFKGARRFFIGLAVVIAGLVALVVYLGADRFFWGLLWFMCGGGVLLFASLIVIGIGKSWRRSQLGFFIRWVIVLGVLGFMLMETNPGPVPDETWIPAALATFLALLFAFFPFGGSGGGGNDDSSDSSDSGWSSSSSSSSSSSDSSSSSSSSDSGGGGSSSGGGASGSW
ncbi:TPM domain-containing protein [Variovorax sp. ZS18.2.2]|uniref:TPM domain-containing protein n=1 Tax=Variovorax sp. ZS18.2.2 TaxID=2971255 RepID=UPI002151B589|nr:TPM domain-containing protein [Variovorax sp. ZS18.2.2]MCR6479329.1 TPM domain-containing protein [Variovorax sp. ZS18.2.2]